MVNFLKKLYSPSRQHVTEDILLSFLDGELSATQTRRVQKHLERCWTCRVGRDRLQNTIGHFVGYRKQIIAPHMPPPPRGRQVFLSKLDELLEQQPPAWWSLAAHQLRLAAVRRMSPIFASILVVVAAVVLLLFIWQRNAPLVSASEFLAKARTWDEHPSPTGRAAVIYQQIAVRTKKRTIERSLYRDASGRRKPRRVAENAVEEQIKQKLQSAGVDWQEPLSAGRYQDWHDHQPVERDEVRRFDGDLLTLTTTVRTGLVAEESLTVRAADFHPLRRMVEMRDAETLEIAELSYAVLGWDAWNDALFEPLTPLPSVAPHEHAALSHPLPTALQLDAAELEARMVLNHLRADTTEQIRVGRSNSHVEVKGIVDTNERKRELVAQLDRIPFVRPAILSAEELNSRPLNASRALPGGEPSVQSYSISGKPSPLAQFIQDRGLSEEDLSQASHRLLDACLKVQQGTSRITELRERFPAPGQLPQSSRSVLQSLFATYAKDINDSLDRELAVLSQVGLAESESEEEGPPPPSEPLPPGGKGALAHEVQQNQELCQELMAGSPDRSQVQPRQASAVASELIRSAKRIRVALSELPIQVPRQVTLSER